ncbi:MAG TPA: hypothetical protein VGC79_09255 [Polyangiaceae bacterium]
MRRAEPRRTTRRLLAMLACGLRMLVLMLGVQLSGTAAVATEAGFGYFDAADCCADCPLESTGKECPPGCPNCHCVHGQIASVPASAPVLELLLGSTDADTAEPPEASAPHAPFLPSLYRPPRAVHA